MKNKKKKTKKKKKKKKKKAVSSRCQEIMAKAINGTSAISNIFICWRRCSDGEENKPEPLVGSSVGAGPVAAPDAGPRRPTPPRDFLQMRRHLSPWGNFVILPTQSQIWKRTGVQIFFFASWLNSHIFRKTDKIAFNYPRE